MGSWSGRVIDRLDKFGAMRLYDDGAIYCHMGDTYAVIRHDTTRNTAGTRAWSKADLLS